MATPFFTGNHNPAATVAVIGGGAAGFFGAIACAEANPDLQVVILERGREVLQKVRVSGGGRCNVTHACFDARALVQYYPRGSRELLGPFLQFGPAETQKWFEFRGVRLKTEEDGRMFPITDDSATIIHCLEQAAQAAGVKVYTGARVERLEPTGQGGWNIHLGNQVGPLAVGKVLVAAGSNPAMWKLLQGLGHTVVEPVPSLFTFNTKDTRLRDLSGLSVADAGVAVPGTKLAARGPLLVTHWGLSGPGILRLSAWGARPLQERDYKFGLEINWTGAQTLAEISAELQQSRTGLGKKTVAAHPRFHLPLRLWQHLVEAAGIDPALRWADLDKKTLQQLAAQLGAALLQITGKSTFKEEFVTAGGISLKEVNFKTFESRLLPNLYLAGEVLDIDAITGGFNFQAAWTGGWLAGRAMAALPTTP